MQWTPVVGSEKVSFSDRSSSVLLWDLVVAVHRMVLFVAFWDVRCTVKFRYGSDVKRTDELTSVKSP